ncbi:MAG: hypothetical protein EOP12_02785 [Pseudomonas sp.]|nr:MAG: hypothetical protein EOP12_02785 [Pseudomonas sp.]
MGLARHINFVSTLSPKSAAIALRLLAKSAALLVPEAGTALHSALQAKSSQAEELSSSDLMVLVTYDRPSPSPFGFAFETANHRMARQWIKNVMEDKALRGDPSRGLDG